MQNSLDESKITHNKRIKDCIILEETEYDVSSSSDLNRDKTFTTNLNSSNKKNVHFDSLNQIKHETPPSLTSITTTTTSFTHPSCSMTSNCVLNSINSNINNNTNKNNNNNNKNFLICLKFPESNRRKLKNNKITRFKVKYIFFVF